MRLLLRAVVETAKLRTDGGINTGTVVRVNNQPVGCVEKTEIKDGKLLLTVDINDEDVAKIFPRERLAAFKLGGAR